MERVIVVGADSYLDPLDLDWLGACGRLKTPGRPDGLMPGEAGACLLIENEADPRRNGRMRLGIQAHAVLRAPPEAGNGDDDGEEGESTPDAIAVGTRLADLLRSVTRGGPFKGDVYADLNGERWKANAWGLALTRLHPTLDFDSYRMISPCECFGETGAAAAPLSVCLAARSFERGYASDEGALVVSISDAGDVGATLVRGMS